MEPTPASGALGATPPSAFCTSCGGPLAAAARFCGSCGSAVTTSTPSPAVPPVGASTGDAPTVVLPHQPAASPGESHATTDGQDGQDGDPAADTEHGVDDVGLPWQEQDAAEPGEEVPSSRRRPRGRSVLAATIALAVAGAGSALGVGHLRDGDARNALASSTRAFNEVVDGLAAAEDAEGAAAAAEEGTAAADRVERALRRLGEADRPDEVLVRDQLESERAVLVAVAALSTLGDEPLATWADAHSPLAAALGAERDARAALERRRPDDAAALSDTGRMLSRLTLAVGPALVDDATAEADRLAAALDAADKTAQLRALAATSATERPGIEAAAQALADGDGKRVLVGYAEALEALSGLGKLDGESTGTWKAVRADLAAALAVVADSAGTAGGALDRKVGAALTSADGVVAAAAAAIADWKAKTDAAVKARTADTEALQAYTSFVRAETKGYEQLRQDLSTFTARVEDPTTSVSYAEGYAFLSEAAADRQSVRDLLVGSAVPDGVQPAHGQVVAAIDRAISAVQSAYDGLEQSQDCYDYCDYYRDTPGWQRFLSESDSISKTYAAALRRWEAAVRAERAAVTNRRLPAKPDV